jgi:DNA-binding transcriptional regulator YhcF (GntR family)
MKKIDRKKRLVAKNISKTNEEINEELVLNAYLFFLTNKNNKTLPSVRDVASKTGLSLPCVQKYKKSIIEMSKAREVRDDLRIYLKPFVHALAKRSINGCTRSSELFARVLGLLENKQEININNNTISQVIISKKEKEGNG